MTKPNTKPNVEELPMLAILPAKGNRANPDLNEEFLHDIATRGVQSPIWVRPDADGYQIIAGERRFLANQRAGRDTIPAIIKNVNEQEARELRLIENLQRTDLNPFDEAAQYKALLEGGMAMKDLAGAIGKKRSHVYARLRLNNLGKDVRKLAAEHEVTSSILELVATIPGPEDQLEAMKEIVPDPKRPWEKEPLSFREAKERIDRDYRKDLKGAPWKFNEAGMFPGAAACETCPNRSGVADPDTSNPNVCLLPSCFEKKNQVIKERKLSELTMKGAKAVNDGNIFWANSADLKSSSGYVKLGEKCEGDKGKRTYGQLVKFAKDAAYGEIPRYAAVDGLGKVVELVKKADVAKALPQHVKFQEEKHSAPTKTPEQKLKEKIEEETGKRALAECYAKIDKGLSESAERKLWLWLVHEAQEYGSFPYEALDKYGMTEKEIDKTGKHRLQAIYIEANRTEFKYEPCIPDTELCEVCGVDTTKIAKVVAEELRVKVKPAKPVKEAKALTASAVAKTKKGKAKK